MLNDEAFPFFIQCKSIKTDFSFVLKYHQFKLYIYIYICSSTEIKVNVLTAITVSHCFYSLH